MYFKNSNCKHCSYDEFVCSMLSETFHHAYELTCYVRKKLRILCLCKQNILQMKIIPCFPVLSLPHKNLAYKIKSSFSTAICILNFIIEYVHNHAFHTTMKIKFIKKFMVKWEIKENGGNKYINIKYINIKYIYGRAVFYSEVMSFLWY